MANGILKKKRIWEEYVRSFFANERLDRQIEINNNNLTNHKGKN